MCAAYVITEISGEQEDNRRLQNNYRTKAKQLKIINQKLHAYAKLAQIATGSVIIISITITNIRTIIRIIRIILTVQSQLTDWPANWPIQSTGI